MFTWLRAALLSSLALSGLTSTAVSYAEVYRYTDAEGHTVFTNTPAKDVTAERITLSPTNSTVMPLPVRKLSPPGMHQTQQHPDDLVRYAELGILSPSADETLRANDRRLAVTVYSQPVLADSHRYQLYLDGKSVGQPQTSAAFYLSEVDRGSHNLKVAVLNAQGKTLQTSAASRFHLRQTTLQDRKRMQPCTLEDYGVRLECPLSEKPKPEAKPFYKKIPGIGNLF